MEVGILIIISIIIILIKEVFFSFIFYLIFPHFGVDPFLLERNIWVGLDLSFA